MKIKGKNKTLTLVNDGEINFLKAPGLTEINFEVVLPMLGPYGFTLYENGFQPPEYYTERLKQIVTGSRAVRFIVSRMSPEGKLLFSTNMLVSVEDYSIKENAKDGMDITVQISLKQYSAFATKTAEISEKTATLEVKTARAAAPQATTYTVKKGDSLWAIAKRHMGNGAKYPQLYSANQTEIDARNSKTGGTKYTIYPGQVFIIP